MTKLLNNSTARSQADDYLNTPSSGPYCALLILDLDNFKQINDTYGHLFGDKILLKAAQAIKSSFRDRDIMARFGGDEFMVLMKDISNPEVIKDRCEKMLFTFHSLLEEYGVQEITGFSIGISLSPLHATSYEQLFKCADAAMYETKKIGKNNFSIYQPAEPVYYY